MADITRDELCSKGIHCWKPTVVLGGLEYLRQCQICGAISYRDRMKEANENAIFLRCLHSGNYRQYADGTIKFGDNWEYTVEPFQTDIKAKEDIDL